MARFVALILLLLTTVDAARLTITTTKLVTKTATAYSIDSFPTVYKYSRYITSTVTQYVASYSLTETIDPGTWSVNSTTTLRAKKTTTVQPPARFTPLSSEPLYLAKIITKTSTVTTTVTVLTPVGKTTVTTLGTSYAYPQVSTLNTDGYAVVTGPTKTSTSTFTYTPPPTSTKYAACNKDNYATVLPNKQITYFAGYDADQATLIANFTLSSTDECCSKCQGLSSCWGGFWWPDRTYPDFKGICYYWTRPAASNTGTCDGSKSYGLFDGQDRAQDDYPPIFFNGGCGQWTPNFAYTT